MSARRVMLTDAEIDALLTLAGRGEDEWEAEGRRLPSSLHAARSKLAQASRGDHDPLTSPWPEVVR